MKTKNCGHWMAAGLAVALPLLGGCVQQAASSTNESAIATNTGVVATTNLPAPPVATATNFPTFPDPTDVRPQVPDVAAAEARPLPPDLVVTPSLGHVIRMINAGVEPSVVVSFITNSAGTFNLGADQIIYLKDIGTPSDVLTAMIERDQGIASGRITVTASTVPAPATGPLTAAVSAPSTAPATASDWRPQAPNTNGVPNPYAPSYSQPQPPAPENEAAVPAPTQPQVVNNNYFFNTLSPYGNWVNIEGYGNCWQPSVTVVNTGWRPYLDGGRWLYTDAGWYWQSDYAWGCTFQYGRWFNTSRFGWCWWPNTVWGPAWVTWRTSPSFCGWAPLPPRCGWTTGVGFTWWGSSVGVSCGFGFGAGYYNWVPWGGFCSSTPNRFCARGPAQVQGLYRNSTVVNNVIIGDNNTIINKGVDVDHVRRYAGRDVPRASIRDVPAAHTASGTDQVVRENGRTVVMRPSGGMNRTASPSAGLVANPGSATAPATPPANRSGTVRMRGETEAAARGVRLASPSLAAGTTPTQPNAATTGRPVAGRGITVSGREASPSLAATAQAQPNADATGRPVAGRGITVSGREASPNLRPATTVNPAVPIARATEPSAPRTATPVTRGTPPATILAPSRTVAANPAPPATAATPAPVARPPSVWQSPAPAPRNDRGASHNAVELASRSPSIVTRTFTGTASSGMSTPSPASTPGPVARPNFTTPQPATRTASPSQSYSPPAAVARTAAPSYAPQAANRPTYSAPAASPSISRPSYSAPAPSAQFSRPTYSAPAPAMSAPVARSSTPMMSAPASRPSSSPAPSSAGRGPRESHER